MALPQHIREEIRPVRRGQQKLVGHTPQQRKITVSNLLLGRSGLIRKERRKIHSYPAEEQRLPSLIETQLGNSAEKVAQATISPPLCHWHQAQKKTRRSGDRWLHKTSLSYETPSFSLSLCVCLSVSFSLQSCRLETVAVTWFAVDLSVGSGSWAGPGRGGPARVCVRSVCVVRARLCVCVCVESFFSKVHLCQFIINKSSDLLLMKLWATVSLLCFNTI